MLRQLLPAMKAGATWIEMSTLGRDDVLLTPHSGYYSDTSNYLVAKLSMDNALYYVNGEYDKVKSIRNGVNA